MISAIYTDGREKFNALYRMRWIMRRNYIHIQYYIIRSDELWKEIEEIPAQERPEQGVEIRDSF